VQKRGQQQGHKPVLDENAVLNDAPLRARLRYVAAGHGIHLVHASAVKACSLAVEVYLRELLQQMLRMHTIRTKQAKDVEGMARDASRNWAREVRPALPTPRPPVPLRMRHRGALSLRTHGCRHSFSCAAACAGGDHR
jgi:hypothetical protein